MTITIKKDIAAAVIRPRITEKAAALVEKNIYVFDVSAEADKEAVSKAVKELYKVIPIDVRIVPVPSKKVVSRGRVGVRKGGRKAYVELKKGDKIDLA